MNTLETMKKYKSSAKKQKIKKNQMEILELKNTITETKKSLMDSTAEWRDRGKNQ